MATLCTDQIDDTSFKDVLTSNIKRLSEECRKMLYESSANIQEAQLLTKALVKCQSCLRTLTKSTSDEKLSKEIVTTLLPDFSQAILDKTFVEENRLVENDFTDNDSRQQLMTILDYLSLPERLGRHYIEITEDDNAKIDNLLTLDILECLSWRRGALLYMYCHTMYNDSNKLKSTQTTDFIKDSQEGVGYLHKMLNVRSPLDDNNTAVESNDNTTAQLIKKGIFSDTHVLALMYAGELYYWQWKIQQQHHKSISELPNTAQDNLTNCKHYLTRYISTVQGPLQGQGWDTIKAEQYLKELN